MDHTDLIPRLRLIMVQWIVQVNIIIMFLYAFLAIDLVNSKLTNMSHYQWEDFKWKMQFLDRFTDVRKEYFEIQLLDCMKSYSLSQNHILWMNASVSFSIPFVADCLFADYTQQCSELELQPETLFLGVSLLDRFLSKGSFNSQRTLVLVGIASLTLATRIEENQPYNR